MANTKIEDLPLLSPEDYNSFTDYIVIQKPGGSTYKMLAGAVGLGGGGGSAARTNYVDTASAGGAYTGGFHYNHTYTQNYGNIEFQEEGLLNSASTFVMNITLSDMTPGSNVNSSHYITRGYPITSRGYETPTPKTFTDKNSRFVKSANLDLVNNSYSTNSTQNYTFFDHKYGVYPLYSGGKSSSFRGWRTNTAKLTCQLVFDKPSDSITFSNITLTHYDINYGRDARYAWPTRVDISADINASIGL